MKFNGKGGGWRMRVERGVVGGEENMERGLVSNPREKREHFLSLT